MAYVCVYGRKRDRNKERNRIVDLMTEAAGTQPTVFGLEDSQGKLIGYRIQHNDLGFSWIERMLPEYAE